MNAKSKADFINSIASGSEIPCPSCGKANSSDSTFCVVCGASLKATEKDSKEQAKAETAAEKPAVTETKSGRYVEPAHVFADGLPDWDVLPPQVMVRRPKR